MYKQFSFTFCFLLLLATTVAAQETITYRYAVHEGRDLYLDLYQPDNPRADQACVLYLFGGGFINGSRDSLSTQQVCQELAKRGFVVAAMDYRLGIRDVKFDTVRLLRIGDLFAHAIDIAVEDCSAAIRFLWDNAQDFNINRDRICLMGSSAGAITVLHTDYARANSLPVAAALPKAFRPAVVAPFAGAILTGNSQMKYATPPAPTCFFHGTDDRIVNYKRLRSSLSTSLFGSSLIVKQFKKNGYPYMIVRIDDRAHEVSGYMTDMMEEFCAFTNIVLSGRKAAYDIDCRETTLKQEPWGKASIFAFF